MSKSSQRSLPPHVAGLLAYLSQPAEKANEDLALAYFRKIFGETFTRQKEAKQADGYVAGYFVLELKGQTKNWLTGLFQGLAYKNNGLDFAQIVVAAKNFAAIWRVEDIPPRIREEIAAERGAPNAIGRKYAKKYFSKKGSLLKLAVWQGGDLFTPLFQSQSDVVLKKIALFEKILREGRKVRLKITIRNFATMLKEMKTFFDAEQPIKAVRAFYSMIYAWTESSTVQVSEKVLDQATIRGELVANLVPGKRQKFKEFVESHYISAEDQSSYDEYFARFDEALDAADKGFRIKHGIFFTDLDLSRFVMWIVRRHIPLLGKNYLVIDPACGSGNLVTNWRSPLELRHKVVSEIEPDLLFAVEQRMKGDAWHNGKFTVVPKVSENKGLNFLNCSADEYLDEIRRGLKEKGLAPDKPLAFLCNPPYRSDDDQTTTAITYKVHPTILDLTGADAANERYCCFLAQMRLICESAKESGLPGESLLLLFTKSAWLTKRAIFQNIRSHMLSSFENISGALFDGSEFFDVAGKWPIAFTIWRYKGNDAGLNANRAVPLVDLTWLKKRDLAQIAWNRPAEMDNTCNTLLHRAQQKSVEIGTERVSIREWSGLTMTDFKRGRRKAEKNQKIVGGLPLDDHRQSNKKAYGELGGQYIGFMDDLTPCRVKNAILNRPWFRLNNQFMDFKKNRCFSGPPTHWGYYPSDLKSAQKLFFWYALARTFIQHPYPMWADSDDMWAPTISPGLTQRTFQAAFAIAYAENECVETSFPANNPVKDLPELFVSNPMTPLNADSFWCKILRPYFNGHQSPAVRGLVDSVDAVFRQWQSLFKTRKEFPVSYEQRYFIDNDSTVTRTAGLVQIKDYAVANNVDALKSALEDMQEQLKVVKTEFYDLVRGQLNYFGSVATRSDELDMPDKTKFEKALRRRLAVAAVLVQRLHGDPNFGRTKLAKAFYLADMHERLNLETEYYREAAGPLDPRALYNERFGIEAMAQKYDLFHTEPKGKMVRYTPAPSLDGIGSFAQSVLGDKAANVIALGDTLEKLTTDQAEIVATLYACWNDFLIRKRSPTDDEIVTEFLLHWHAKKSRFSRSRLAKALVWMREHDLIPAGRGKLTTTRIVN